jgi:hypothetical protein
MSEWWLAVFDSNQEDLGGDGWRWTAIAAGTKKCSFGTSLGHRLVREAMITDHERWTDSTNYTVCALAL